MNWLSESIGIPNANDGVALNNSFEGDLIRPLGLVTLYFAYAEYELDQLLKDLGGGEAHSDESRLKCR